jgi:hypothetical protein
LAPGTVAEAVGGLAARTGGAAATGSSFSAAGVVGAVEGVREGVVIVMDEVDKGIVGRSRGILVEISLEDMVTVCVFSCP